MILQSTSTFPLIVSHPLSRIPVHFGLFIYSYLDGRQQQGIEAAIEEGRVSRGVPIFNAARVLQSTNSAYTRTSVIVCELPSHIVTGPVGRNAIIKIWARRKSEWKHFTFFTFIPDSCPAAHKATFPPRRRATRRRTVRSPTSRPSRGYIETLSHGPIYLLAFYTFMPPPPWPHPFPTLAARPSRAALPSTTPKHV